MSEIKAGDEVIVSNGKWLTDDRVYYRGTVERVTRQMVYLTGYATGPGDRHRSTSQYNRGVVAPFSEARWAALCALHDQRHDLQSQMRRVSDEMARVFTEAQR